MRLKVSTCAYDKFSGGLNMENFTAYHWLELTAARKLWNLGTIKKLCSLSYGHFLSFSFLCCCKSMTFSCSFIFCRKALNLYRNAENNHKWNLKLLGRKVIRQFIVRILCWYWKSEKYPVHSNFACLQCTLLLWKSAPICIHGCSPPCL